ncbi:hypothetical protein IEN85_18965 [Pelagicoccus sp. NFK12]|uniref:Uncharacterized protein n=1 Tax=Pelagicoccus enzymogenes TaxID=2773457 RepID=A0A927IIT4_9BACT|nr:hypothetical protein [Pelagicoccus enzymogenes]MBD5781591.1 hypothetical protein [Pelagicoccus enzymogenes]MDQ8200068.1 hypothetical protein [Pelagicoccus enzymogenes]
MKRLFIAALALACACSAKEYEPNELEIAVHRREVYQLARDYVVDTFNLQLIEESEFNPVRFNSNGVWGDFEARIKELGGDRYEVQGWVNAVGHEKARIRWAVHIRYGIVDPQAWRYMKIDETIENEPEILGWKFGEFRSPLYKADYDPLFVARVFKKDARARKN